MKRSAAPRTPPPKPTFSFEGTVQKVRAATMKGVPVDDRTAVVKVDRVLEAPADLLHYRGRDVTVRLAAGERLRSGRSGVFHTVGWMFGDGLALRSVGSARVAKAAARAPAMAGALAQVDDPVERRALREAQERFDAADVVVSGRVTAVRLPAARRAAAATERPTSRRPVSEHDPKWRDAVVDVEDVHKGAGVKRRIVVRFPASRDVKWFQAHKFQAGEEGVFLLRKPGPAPAMRAAGIKPARAEPVYTALHAADFHPITRAQRIRSVIATARRRPSR